ncbi:LysR family transcriptional regulator [Paludibaculum fermentans]|uniref:LysR family transcriptional regulator n=1 Tax=Paludibaculum fermentans TaxID=1473598 RepID=A0A7S7NWU8_PALFE|nr:LysR family transcriptional regulator [Paludibaculum fermentans]QOY91276.1 LysR family transcriptional regulator [Paludibaculum fermentans]
MALKTRARGFDLRQLEYFCAVARTGSFTKAADDLGIAQPSLSEQIARLEEGLGGALFERLNRRVELTPLGEAILGKAQALLEDAAALPDHFERARKGMHGPLRVGAIPTILPYYLTPLLKGFIERYQDVDLHVREGTTAELVELVLEGQMDVAVVSLPVEGAGLVMKELFRDPLYLAVPESHPLAGAEKVQLRRVSEERLLILKDGHCLRDETLAVCDRARARFSGQFEADQFLTIFELIRAGFGVSIVPEMGRGLSAGCRMIELEPKASRRVGYIRLERRYLSKALEAFTGYLRESAEKRKK